MTQFKGKPPIPTRVPPINQPSPGQIVSLLGTMQDGKEYASIANLPGQINVKNELTQSLAEIKQAREGRYNICYVSNVLRSSTLSAIDQFDDLPFSEMCNAVPNEVKDIDLILITPGGSAQQVSKFVDKLRNRFENITFILPNIAMSAGTIFALSGDDIIMTSNSYIGPIDPQVINREGRFFPAQSLLTYIDEIKKRGEIELKAGRKPSWTDIQLLNNIDAKEIGSAITSSEYSIKLVSDYLEKYKFKSWNTHRDGRNVTPKEKTDAAKKAASHLCNHDHWKSHGAGISREIAFSECGIKIQNSESIPNLDKAIKRFWALNHWLFERTPIQKIIYSSDYQFIKAEVKNL